MTAQSDRLAHHAVLDAQKYFQMYVPRIIRCLSLLSDEEIWWRANESSNSAGNLLLHLSGNIRQWIVSGLSGTEDVRQRDLEFSAHGPVPRRALVAQFRSVVAEALRVLRRLSPNDLERLYVIQGFHVTGLVAISQVTQHLSYHAGQIIFVTKMKTGRDLRFTKLPPLRPRKNAAGNRASWPPVASARKSARTRRK